MSLIEKMVSEFCRAQSEEVASAPPTGRWQREIYPVAMRAALLVLAKPENIMPIAEIGLKEFNRVSHALLPEDDYDILAFSSGLSASIQATIEE